MSESVYIVTKGDNCGAEILAVCQSYRSAHDFLLYALREHFKHQSAKLEEALKKMYDVKSSRSYCLISIGCRWWSIHEYGVEKE